jgi:hypothetical protein
MVVVPVSMAIKPWPRPVKAGLTLATAAGQGDAN